MHFSKRAADYKMKPGNIISYKFFFCFFCRQKPQTGPSLPKRNIYISCTWPVIKRNSKSQIKNMAVLDGRLKSCIN